MAKQTLRCRRRVIRIVLIVAIGVTIAVPVITPTDAAAQSAKRGSSSMKRGTGSMSRGSGTRQSGSMSARKTGRSASVRADRTGSKPSFRSPNKDDEPSESTVPSSGSDAETGDSDSALADSTTAESSAPADFDKRTLGKACMYGTRGEVIYRPRGSRCRGDSPKARPKKARRQLRLKAETPPAKMDSPAEKDTTRPKSRALSKRQRAPEPERPRGTCIFGGDGRLVYAPAGRDCQR